MSVSENDYEALAESHRRLRRAARAVIDACSYEAGNGVEPRVYASQLRQLERELEGVPQPCNRLTWMSPT